MQNLRNKIPPLRSLIAFEAAARKLSFTKAAEELAVTQVAISRQIKQLEEYVGQPLFHRLNRAVSLTPEGIILHKSVIDGLSEIANTVVDIQQNAFSNNLMVGTTTAFSAYWLMPRIAEFCKLFPEIDLRFSVTDNCVNLKPAGIHISIRYGHGNWPGLDSLHLCDSDVLPLCSPSYWKDRPLLNDPQDLLSEFLIDFDYIIDSRWESWFKNLGYNFNRDPAHISIDAYTSMVNATLSGQGIALLGAPLVNEYITNGALICPINIEPQKLAGGYYLVTPKTSDPCPALHSFRDWIIENISVV